MSSKYGSESYSVEFRDLQATTMSVDRNGHFALLAGRKYLSVINLEVEPPGQLAVRVPYGGKYEISNTQWCRMANNALIGVASSQRCDIYELTDGSELKCIYKLKGHTRVITDLDWSTVSPSLLATSSFDSYVHIWDLRSPRDPGCEKPHSSLSALDGASQVKWNKWKTDQLASCDGGHVKIWDVRKPNSPLEFIAAHAARINGLEWIAKDVVVTAAQDCTVRFNRLSSTNPKNVKGPCLTMSTPIWRARPTPFGRGIITQCVPILRRDSGLLSLWNWQNSASPIFTFQAHDIVEFAWKRSTNTNCDLLTWSRDQTLRVWSLPREVIELCGEETWPAVNNQNLAATPSDNPSALESDALENYVAPLSSRRGSKVSPKKEGSLERKFRKSGPQITQRDEFLNEDFETVSDNMSDNVSFEEVDVQRGLLRFAWKPDPKSRVTTVVVQVSFPINYPASAPSFLVARCGSDIDKALLVKTLAQTAQACARKNESCLGSCIAQFTAFMMQNKILEEAPPPSPFPSRGVSNVPFPRTSGARFCSVGVLVCFGRPSYLKRVKSNCDAGTPRSLSALGPFLSQLADESSSVVPQGVHKSRRTRRVEKKRAGLVTLFDVTPLLPLTKELASTYKHVSSQNYRKAICAENAQIARNSKKLNVAHTWQAASTIADFTCSYNHSGANQNPQVEARFNESSTYDDEEDFNFIIYHPLGSDLVHNMITHYAMFGDLQTAATVACHYTVPSPGQDHCQHGYQQLQPAAESPLEVSTSLSRSGHAASQPPWSILPSSSKTPRLIVPKWWTKGLGSPYHTVTGSDSLHGIMIPSPTPWNRQHRSNSWSESLDEGKMMGALHDGASGGSNGNGYLVRETWNNGGKPGYLRGAILDPTMGRIYDGYKKAYAEILYRWGLLQQRAEVLKCLTSGVESSFLLRSGVDYVIQCKTCGQPVKGSHCSTCKRMISICAICNMPAKGLCTFCAACGHGGHAAHMLEWFKAKRKTCPTGCGCLCLTENARIFK